MTMIKMPRSPLSLGVDTLHKGRNCQSPARTKEGQQASHERQEPGDSAPRRQGDKQDCRRDDEVGTRQRASEHVSKPGEIQGFGKPPPLQVTQARRLMFPMVLR